MFRLQAWSWRADVLNCPYRALADAQQLMNAHADFTRLHKSRIVSSGGKFSAGCMMWALVEGLKSNASGWLGETSNLASGVGSKLPEGAENNLMVLPIGCNVLPMTCGVLTVIPSRVAGNAEASLQYVEHHCRFLRDCSKFSAYIQRVPDRNFPRKRIIHKAVDEI